MQLDLGTRHSSIRIDSRLDCFAEVARTAARHVLRRGGTLDATTLFNLDALGVAVDRDG